MKLDKTEFKRFKTLEAKLKTGKVTPEEKEELAILLAKKKEGTNDVEWYKKYPQLFDAVSSIAWDQIAGVLSPQGAVTKFATEAEDFIVGHRFEFIFTIGNSFRPTDAFNLQMKNLWLQMHHKYRGLSGYDSADVGMTILAVLGVFMEVARAERVYGLLRAYNIHNRSKPNKILEALDIDPTSIRSDDIPNFRAELNMIIAQLKTLCLPKGITALEKAITLLSYVFEDSDNNKSCWFVYDTPYRMYYKPTTYTTGGAVGYRGRTKSSSGKQTLGDIIDNLHADVDIIFANTDIARICSDLLAFGGDENVVSFAEVPEEYETPFYRDDTRLLQMHNSIIANDPLGNKILPSIYTEMTNETGFNDSITPLTIYQSNNVIYQNLQFGSNSYYQSGMVNVSGVMRRCWPSLSPGTPLEYVLVDTWTAKPSLDEKCEILQYAVSGISQASGDSAKPYTWENVYGTIVITKATGFRGATGATTYISINSYTSFNAQKAATISCLDWAPYMYIVPVTQPVVGEMQISQIVGDRDNYTFVSCDTLDKIHRMSTLSLFSIPNSPLKE